MTSGGFVQMAGVGTAVPDENSVDTTIHQPLKADFYDPSPLAVYDYVDAIDFGWDNTGETLEFENMQTPGPDYATIQGTWDDDFSHYGYWLDQDYSFEDVDPNYPIEYLVIDIPATPTAPIQVSVSFGYSYSTSGEIVEQGVYWIEIPQFLRGIGPKLHFAAHAFSPIIVTISQMYICLDVTNVAPAIVCNDHPPEVVRNAHRNVSWSITDPYNIAPSANYKVWYMPVLPPGFFMDDITYETGDASSFLLPHIIDLACISTHWISQYDYYDDFRLGGWIFVIEATDGYESTELRFFVQVVPEPPLLWETPIDGQYMLFGPDCALLNISYYTEGYDRVDLYLNDYLVSTNASTGEVTATIDLDTLYESLHLDGTVVADLRGYVGDTMIKEVSHTFTFGRILSSVLDILEQNTTTIGEQLYFILHDPNGDNSYSSFSQTSKVTMGVNLEITSNSGDKWEIGYAPELDGISPSMSFSLESSASSGVEFDLAYDITDMYSLTSSKISDDRNFIGPGFGDIYIGEGWVLNWCLKQIITTYANGTTSYSKPLLQYGILKDATLICSDSHAPPEWQALNPVHNDYQGVQWSGTNLGPFGGWGGEEYTASHTVTQTASVTRSFSFTISEETEAKVEVSGFSIGRTISTSLETKNTVTNGFENEFCVSYSIYDEEGNDFIAMERGIDLTYGTYIFRTVPDVCETSYPLEYNTLDHEAPIFPDMPSCTQEIVHGTDAPLITGQITDEGGVQLARVYYSLDGGVIWDFQALTEQQGNLGNWEGHLPPAPRGTTVLWYLKAWDLVGNSSIKKNAYNDYFTYTVVNSPPTVQILGPTGGEIFRETCPITWDAIDVDNDALTFDLLYNIANTGWHYIAQGITGTAFYWDVSDMPFSENYAIKIVASDDQEGIAEDLTRVAFEIDDVPSISHPADISYIENDGSAHYISWTITDNHAVNPTYRILVDGVQKRTGTWQSGSTDININAGGFSEGIYRVLLEVNEEGYIVNDEVFLWVLKQEEVETPLNTVGGADLEGQTNYGGVPLGDSGLIIQEISTITPDSTVITSGLWETNPTSGTAPFDDLSATYFAIDTTTPENIVFDDPNNPFIVLVPLPLSFDNETDSLIIMTWDETLNQWGPAAFAYSINEEDWTASIQIEHLSLFMLAVNNPEDMALYRLTLLVDKVTHSSPSIWSCINNQQAMLDKLAEVSTLATNGNYLGAYGKLLHDIKPKLTSKKVDENGYIWGNGVFNNPWITDSAAQTLFSSTIDDVLRYFFDIGADETLALIEKARAEASVLLSDVTLIENDLLQLVLEWTIGSARENFNAAWHLYVSDHSKLAEVRIYIADCQVTISGFVVKIGAYLGAIPEDLAKDLEINLAEIDADIITLLALL